MVYAVCTDGSGSVEEGLIKTHGRPTLKIEAFTKEGHNAHNVLLWLNPDADILVSDKSGKGRSIDGSELIKFIEGLTSGSNTVLK